MQAQLMTEEIEIDPLFGAAPFFTAEQVTLKSAPRIQIIDVDSEVEDRLHASCNAGEGSTQRLQESKRARWLPEGAAADIRPAAFSVLLATAADPAFGVGSRSRPAETKCIR